MRGVLRLIAAPPAWPPERHPRRQRGHPGGEAL